MDSQGKKPHAVLVPFPAQGHVNPFMELAKLLHQRGFYITFVNTEFNHQRLLRSRGEDSLRGMDDFRFEAIPDGLPPSDLGSTQHIPSICHATTKNCLAPFRSLLHRLQAAAPAVPQTTSIISDGIMSFALDAGEELGLPVVLFWTPSAIGLMCYLHYQQFVDRGIVPLKDESCLTSGYLDMPIDWIPGTKDLRLRDVPSFVRTTDPDDIMLRFYLRESGRTPRATAIIVNSFDDLEGDVLDAMKSIIPPPIYTIGPISILAEKTNADEGDGAALRSIRSNLWEEDASCFEWLDMKEPNSVVFVNFGSITVMTSEQLEEFAWGLAGSGHPFLWIVRPDLVTENRPASVLSPEFLAMTRDRGMISSWCDQERVLRHPSIGVFLTHSGWNSTLESICGGVPVICWPFFAEQQTNCRYACRVWRIGMEIDGEVTREAAEATVREMMEGEGGKRMRKRAQELKGRAMAAASHGGSSSSNMDKVVALLSSAKI